ncbi:unnamed protein product [Dracunculus medinensis]|uniref:DUF1741 domain-containing protein n=1 Tax=Dracunculus medinensis TaxID=318479 RepID=A0A0N4U9H2_DRAME|nr:unnamed protein product [Dracunculus medinensis]
MIIENISEVDWYQFFTLRYNSQSLLFVITKIENDLYLKKKVLLQIFFKKCCEFFAASDNIRMFNAAQSVMLILFKAICDILRHTCPLISRKLDAFIFILGKDSQRVTKNIASRCALLIHTDNDLSRFTLNFLVSVLCAGNVSSFVENFLSVDFYDLFFNILIDDEQISNKKEASLFLITILIDYCHFNLESAFFKRFSMENRDNFLENYCEIIHKWLINCVRAYQSQINIYNPSSSLWGSIANTVSNLLQLSDNKSNIKFISKNEKIEYLIALGNIIRYNRNVSPYLLNNLKISLNLTEDSNDGGANIDSYGDYTKKRCALGLLILIFMIHDVNLASAIYNHESNTVVALYQSQMLHRDEDLIAFPTSFSLADAICDIICEFFISHVCLNFPFELYELAIGVVHRMITYAKRMCIRMAKWKPLFEALLSLLNFLASNDSYLGLRAYYLCLRIMVILNLFITYGDTFLPTDVAYDYMCYEILRRQSVFHKVLNKAMRIRDQHQDNEQYLMTKTMGISRLLNQLENPLEIVNHFQNKISRIPNPSEDEVLEVIRTNFHSLQLKLYEGLEIFEKHEKASECIVDDLVELTKKNSTFYYGLHNFNFTDMLNLLSSMKS